MLEENEFITRQAYAEIPPRVVYRLTEKGQAIAEILQALADFGEQYLSNPPSMIAMEAKINTKGDE